MRFIDMLCRKTRYFGIANLMMYVTITQLAVYGVMFITGYPLSYWLNLYSVNVMNGEIWRVVTFLAVPPGGSVFGVLISLYFYFFVGTALERAWGTAKFTWYYIFGALAALIAGMIIGVGTNTYLNMSLFFAFAALYPEQQVLLFFVIPIKVKWLGYLNAAFYLISFITGGWVARFAIVFSLINFFVFFGGDTIRKIKDYCARKKRKREWDQKMNDAKFYWQ
jgi:membrane associated rhomboid family serine protease